MNYPVIFLVIIAVAIIDVLLRKPEDTFTHSLRSALYPSQSTFDKILAISKFFGIYVFISCFFIAGGIMSTAAGLLGFIVMQAAGNYLSILLVMALVFSVSGIFAIRLGISFLFFREFVPDNKKYDLKFALYAK
jgi:hypothetical protein